MCLLRPKEHDLLVLDTQIAPVRWLTSAASEPRAGRKVNTGLVYLHAKSATPCKR